MRILERKKDGRRGASLIEFTLVGIPIIFLLISVFEISRGMWLYQTAAHASREAARYIVVHGSNCKDDTDPCGRTVSEIAQELKFHLVGLDPNEVELTLRAGCSDGGAMRVACATNETKATLQTYLSNTDTTHWPGATGASLSLFFVEVEIEFPFRSAIAMFWPGAGRGQSFGTVPMFAASREMFQF